jgi:hypothetical protein
LTDNYFGTILTDYQRIYGPIRGLYYEPRGFLIEPHTGREIPLGTREVADYEPPQYLYNKLLYVEKQGLVPIFKAVKLAQRFDIGILAAPGYATRAAKDLLKIALENITHNITVLCLHDCDVDGLMIAKTLARGTPARPTCRIDVIDLGLFVYEVMDLGLETEEVVLYKGLPWELQESLTQTEIDFLTGGATYRDDKGKRYWKGKRVELNALTPAQLIGYIETKLKEHGLTEKVCPPDDVIKNTANEILEEKLEQKLKARVLELVPVGEISPTLREKADLSSLPASLKQKLRDNPPEGWESIVGDEVNAEVERVVCCNDSLIRDFAKNRFLDGKNLEC